LRHAETARGARDVTFGKQHVEGEQQVEVVGQIHH
jgi:hypothetical protein